MILTKNFSKSELEFSQSAIRAGISNITPADLMPNLRNVAAYLQKVRDALSDHLGRDTPIHVHSCYRSPELNRLVGGAQNSDHMEALAADITVAGMSPIQLALFIRDHVGGYDKLINEFGQWVHVSVPVDGTEGLLHDMTAQRRKHPSTGKTATVYLNGIVEV